MSDGSGRNCFCPAVQIGTVVKFSSTTSEGCGSTGGYSGALALSDASSTVDTLNVDGQRATIQKSGKQARRHPFPVSRACTR